jgi:hypothetical protein
LLVGGDKSGEKLAGEENILSYRTDDNSEERNFLKCTLLCPFTNPVRERHYSQDSQVLAGQSIKDAGVLIARGRGKVSARNENNLLYWTD